MMKFVLIPVLYFYILLSKIWWIRRKSKPNSVLYLAAFFPENAGYHWRVKSWADALIKDGYRVDIHSVFNQVEFYSLLDTDVPMFHLKFLHKRFWQVITSVQYETVIVTRELLIFNDYGNLFLEKLLLRIHPNVILDFDDDLAASKGQPKKILNLYARLMMEHGDKFNETLRNYKQFIVPSAYLKEYILNENPKLVESNICIIPTCTDYDRYSSKDYSEVMGKYTIGWIGNDYNYVLIDKIIPVLNKLSTTHDFKLCVIGKSPYQAETKFEIQFVKWSLDTEVENLLKFDIGIMPLLHDKESKGKAAFKLVQYMGLGIVSIATPVTINKDIVHHSVNSFLCNTEDEWESVLRDILDGKIDMQKMGNQARETIMSGYTINANREKYINFIHQCAG